MGNFLFAKSLKIFFVVLTYWVVSIWLVLLDKYLPRSKHLKLEAPYFITWFQCVTSLVVLFLLNLVGDKCPSIDSFPSFKIEMRVAKEILPLSVAFIGMITANNLCLKYLDEQFNNAVRALTTYFYLFFSYFILEQKISTRVMMYCGLIIAALFLDARIEYVMINLSYKGVLFGILNALFVCLNAIYTKKCMPAVDGNIWKLQMYNLFNAVFLFQPLMFFNDEHSILLSYTDLKDVLYSWFMMSMSGLFIIGTGLVTGLQIKVTSPLTHNISDTALFCVQAVFAAVVNAGYKTELWWTSNIIVLFGSALYTYVKHSDMKVNQVLEEKDKQNKMEKI